MTGCCLFGSVYRCERLKRRFSVIDAVSMLLEGTFLIIRFYTCAVTDVQQAVMVTLSCRVIRAVLFCGCSEDKLIQSMF